MPDQKLLEYIQQQVSTGASRADMSRELISAGWGVDAITQAMTTLNVPLDALKTIEPITPIIVSSDAHNDPVSIGGAYSETWKRYRNQAGTFTAIMAAAFFVQVLFAGAVIGGIILAKGVLLFVSIIAIVGVTFMIGMSVWSTAALYMAVTSPDAAFRASFHKAVPIAGSVVWILILLGLIIPGGFLLLFVPGLIFAARFAFAPFVLLDENQKGINALLRSAELVKGETGRVLGQLLAFFAPYLILQFILNSTPALLGYQGISALMVSGVAVVVMIALQFILVPFAVVYTFTIYQSIKRPLPAYTRSGWQRAGLALVSILGFLVYIGAHTAYLYILDYLSPPSSSIPAISETANTTAASASIPPSGIPNAEKELYISLVQVALEKYYANSTYPPSLQTFASTYLGADTEYIYDPITHTPFSYQATSGGKDFKLCATLSNGDPYCVTKQSPVSPVLQQAFVDAQKKRDVAVAEADMSTVQTEAELYWGGAGNKSYGIANSCSEGMFANDITNAKALSMVAQKSTASLFCRANGTAYVVYAPLQTSSGWCIDSTGVATTTGHPAAGAYACP